MLGIRITIKEITRPYKNKLARATMKPDSKKNVTISKRKVRISPYASVCDLELHYWTQVGLVGMKYI